MTDLTRATKILKEHGNNSLAAAYDDGVVARDARLSRDSCPFPMFDKPHRAAWLRGYDYAIR